MTVIGKLNYGCNLRTTYVHTGLNIRSANFLTQNGKLKDVAAKPHIYSIQTAKTDS